MEWRPLAWLPGARVIRLVGLGLLVVALSFVAGTLLLPLAARGFVGAIESIMNACVWLALSVSAGMSAWSILGVVGQAAEGLITSGRASVALTVLVAVGVLAAYGLQRVLGYPGDELSDPADAPANVDAEVDEEVR